MAGAAVDRAVSCLKLESDRLETESPVHSAFLK
jgi:hypothetical protein